VAACWLRHDDYKTNNGTTTLAGDSPA
jgi:hypothetical protein